MIKRRCLRLLLTALLCGSSALCWPDTTVRIQTIITDFDKNPNIKDPSVIQKIQYRHGMMRREDSLSGGIAAIANCETKTGLLIDWMHTNIEATI